MTLVIMVMIVAAACAVRTVIVMMFMLVVVIMMVLVLFMVVMVMLMLFRFKKCRCHVICGERVLDRLSDLCAGELLPRCGDDLGVVVNLTDQLDCSVELALGDVAGAGQDDGAGILDLVLVEFFKVLQVDLALAGIDDGNGAAYFGTFDLFDGSYDVRKFADAGRLDENTVRSIFVDDFLQCGAEVTYEGAADTAGVHLGDLDAGFLQESAVDTDLTELVLDEDELLSVIAVCDELLDECGLSGT